MKRTIEHCERVIYLAELHLLFLMSNAGVAAGKYVMHYVLQLHNSSLRSYLGPFSHPHDRTMPTEYEYGISACSWQCLVEHCIRLGRWRGKLGPPKCGVSPTHIIGERSRLCKGFLSFLPLVGLSRLNYSDADPLQSNVASCLDGPLRFLSPGKKRG
jgi:hypothetical protein